MSQGISELIAGRKAIILEFDQVIYPEKDYVLQVYYLFASFLSYTEQMDAEELVKWMQEEYEKNGGDAMYEKTAAHFGINPTYAVHFERLFYTARLPLKLLMFQKVQQFLKEMLYEGKSVLLWVRGNRGIALNKLNQLEWNGLQHHVRIYFEEDEEDNWEELALERLLEKENLRKEEVLFITSSKVYQEEIKKNNISAVTSDIFF